MFWFTIYFLIFLMSDCHAKKDKRECCIEGRNFAINSWSTHHENISYLSRLCSKESIRSQLKKSNREVLKTRKCSFIAQSCCMRIIKTEICKSGASQLENCDSPTPGLSISMTQIKMECCLCCEGNSSVPLEDLESCSFLEGKCPRKDLSDISKQRQTTSLPPTDSRIRIESSYSIQSLGRTESLTRNTSEYSQISSAIGIQTKNETFNNIEGSTETSNTTEGPIPGTIGPKSIEDKTDFPSFYNDHKEIGGSSTVTTAIELNNQTTEYSETSLGTKYNTGDNETQISKPTSSLNDQNQVMMTTTASPYLSSSDTTTISAIICENGRKWDPQLQVCVQLVISCPQNFILHPHEKRCVEVIQPEEPCQIGFLYDQFKQVCIDIDECANGSTCKDKLEICVNTNGSFKCSCKLGFKHNKQGVCEDINECNNMDICSAEQKCKNTPGSYKCIRAIPCGFGWKEDPETNDCVDVDECESFPGICGVGMKCVNIRGSHKCEDDECPGDMKRNNRGICSRCKDGFRFDNETQMCEDIDECNMHVGWYNGRCKDTEICFNLPGSYECIPKKKCRSGTILTKNGTSCEDIDECKQMKFRCETDQVCINTYSSYQCIASPCAPSQQYEYETSKCICKDGFQLTGDNVCTDIDECSENGLENLCGSLFICINHPGSYSCIHKAECPSGMFRSSMYSSCQDVDECETGEGKCPPNMYCVNMVGSYKCMCNRGYTMMPNNTCADVNECLLFRPEESCPDLEARCINTAGSYKCHCPKGFQWSNYPIKRCTDINECQNANPCGKRHECINTLGSYKCKCFQGYRLGVSGDTCEDIDECLLEPRKCVNGFCVNLPGRYTCRCPPGFTLDSKEICQDIDECSSFDGVCPNNDQLPLSKMCINLLGYYKCVNSTCPPEYSKKDTGNGFICLLNKDSRCKLRDTNCLFSRPYRKIYEFMEITTPFRSRRTLSRFNFAHLPSGINIINLQVKYAHNTDTKEFISVQKAFHLVTDRYNRDNIELVLVRQIQAPAEILLYLEVKRFHQKLYFGHSHAFIHIFLTKYPVIST